ncbi:ABC transporter ATP-binding protein [Henriciella aquimarina]|uniref:ABC transporter ATP-binding protein n=1 Tax=Henriciella aquimarina TaxID=545261 RepID=UPI0009FE1871|nr:ABC transporter ATP-binding protein [Henriciella aquimarina]
MTEASNDVILKASGVYKKFGRSNLVARRQLAARLGAVLTGRSARHKRIRTGDFWSLQDINLEVQRGEVLGVIGLNGAGKSTLLRVLYGLMAPDLGEIEVNGETGALIELGAGFETSLSGRENVFIKGALMGRSRREMEEMFPAIHKFSELGDFINSPISGYSSGMRLRLAFAIASTITPDLLLLDEIVSVGDFSFKQKCRSRLNEMSERAGVVFASHSMSDIRSMCTKAIVLQKGQIMFRGEPDLAIDFYTDMQAQIESKRVAPARKEPEKAPPKEPAKAASPAKTPDSPEANIIKDTRFGVIAMDRKKVSRADHYWKMDGKPANVLDTCKPASFHFEIECLETIQDIEIGLMIWDEKGNKLAPITTEFVQPDRLREASGKVKGEVSLPQFSLVPGRYVTTIAISEKGLLLYRNVLEEISVVSSARSIGVVRLPAEWKFGDDADVA